MKDRLRTFALLGAGALFSLLASCSSAPPQDRFEHTRELLAQCRALGPTQDPSVTPPVPTVQPNPIPPRDIGSAFVCVLATIDVKGNVVNPRILKTSNALFAREFLTALQSWRYKPALKAGAPVAIDLLVSSSFTRP